VNWKDLYQVISASAPAGLFAIPVLMLLEARARKAHQVEAAWAATAKALSLQSASVRRGYDRRMSGTIEGFAVEVRMGKRIVHETEGIQTQFLLDGGGKIPRTLRIRAEKDRSRPARDLQSHDASFDAIAWLDGPEPLVVAVLDAHTRELILQLLRYRGARIQDGKMEVAETDALSDAARPREILLAITAVARRLDVKSTDSMTRTPRFVCSRRPPRTMSKRSGLHSRGSSPRRMFQMKFGVGHATR
jgi:hypothetical protein